MIGLKQKMTDIMDKQSEPIRKIAGTLESMEWKLSELGQKQGKWFEKKQKVDKIERITQTGNLNQIMTNIGKQNSDSEYQRRKWTD